MGYGDEIMITGYARALKLKYPNHQIVAGNKEKGIVNDSVIFDNNPNIKRFSELQNIQTIWIDSYSGHRPYFIKETENRYHWNINHKTQVGELYFSKFEYQFALNIISKAKKWWKKEKNYNFENIIFLEPSRIKTTKNNASQNRNWGLENWKKFVNIHKDKYLFVQSIFKNSDLISGTFKFESNFREACAVLNKCDYTIGGEGGFTHAAAALKKKGLFIYGGWVHPSITGYKIHKNIYIDIEGSPCGMKVDCEHCKKCKEIMTVEMITKNFREILSN